MSETEVVVSKKENTTDYISREAAMIVVKTWNGQKDCSVRLKLMVDDLEMEPAADVRPVVECMGCAFLDEAQDGKCCMFSVECTRIYTPPDGFCFAGIRREEANS